jgi:hypothetical protein
LLIVVACAVTGAFAAGPVFAHGPAGNRFFPQTLVIQDPFASDALSVPTISHRKLPASDGQPATTETATSVNFSKRMTPNFAIGLNATYLNLNPDEGTTTNGFDNYALTFKYQFHEDDTHETVASFALNWDIGGSGVKRVGAQSFSTLIPTLLFGKGFGGTSAKYLRPFAVATQLGFAYPTDHNTTITNAAGQTEAVQNPNAVNWGFAIEYSLPYLKSFVSDTNVKKPFAHLVPLVEFAFQTPVSQGSGGTTGTVNPGVLWVGNKMQLGIEAIVPVNDSSGKNIGVIAQLHFYMDRIWGAP